MSVSGCLMSCWKTANGRVATSAPGERRVHDVERVPERRREDLRLEAVVVVDLPDRPDQVHPDVRDVVEPPEERADVRRSALRHEQRLARARSRASGSSGAPRPGGSGGPSGPRPSSAASRRRSGRSWPAPAPAAPCRRCRWRPPRGSRGRRRSGRSRRPGRGTAASPSRPATGWWWRRRGGPSPWPPSARSRSPCRGRSSWPPPCLSSSRPVAGRSMPCSPRQEASLPPGGAPRQPESGRRRPRRAAPRDRLGGPDCPAATGGLWQQRPAASAIPPVDRDTGAPYHGVSDGAPVTVTPPRRRHAARPADRGTHGAAPHDDPERLRQRRHRRLGPGDPERRRPGGLLRGLRPHLPPVRGGAGAGEPRGADRGSGPEGPDAAPHGSHRRRPRQPRRLAPGSLRRRSSSTASSGDAARPTC